MDTNVQTLLIVLAVVAFTALIVAVVLPLLKRKGVEMDEVLGLTKSALTNVNATMATLRPFLPQGKGVTTFDQIMAAAQVGVANAEQLHKIGELEPAERKEAARQYIVDAVQLMGVEVNDDVERLIDGAIEAKVLELGHVPIAEAQEVQGA